MAATRSDAKNGLVTSDSSDEENWLEVDSEEQIDVKCLFCDSNFTIIDQLWSHCDQQHSFNIKQFIKRKGLDFYGYIKLINYIRKEQPSPIFVNNDSSCPWEAETFLKPVLTDDALLHYDIEDEEFVDENSPDNNSAISSEIKLKIAEERATKAEFALQQAMADLNDLRSEMKSMLFQGDDGLENADLSDEEDGYFSSYSHFSIHHEMLKDKVRTLSYKKFIESNPHLFKDKCVLDVGCGTGILSLFAAQAGARKVIGVDNSTIAYNAMDIVRENKFDNIIKIVRGKVEEIDLEEKFDLIISEWMGYFLLFESMLDTVLLAKEKWLAPGGKVYPDKCTINLVGLQDDERIRQNIDFWNDVYGFKMSCMKKAVVFEAITDIVKPEFLLTESCVVKNINVNSVKKDELDFKSDFQLTATNDGKLNILAGYFDIFFDEECLEKVSFSSGPRSQPTHWKQTLFYLPRAIPLTKGETVEGFIECRKNKKYSRSLDIDIGIRENTAKDFVTSKFVLQ